MNRTKKICIAAAALLLILGIAGSIFIRCADGQNLSGRYAYQIN